MIWCVDYVNLIGYNIKNTIKNKSIDLETKEFLSEMAL